MNNSISVISYNKTLCSSSWEVVEQNGNFHRMYYIYDGEARYLSENDDLCLKKGYLYLFPTYKNYKIEHNPLKPLHCLWVHLTIFPPISNNIVVVEVVKPMEYILKVLETVIEDNYNREALVENLVISILQLIDMKNIFNYIEDERIEKLIKFIHKNYRKKITSQDLSRISGLNNKYLIKLFKQYFKLSPQKYIQAYRLSIAEKLLIKGICVENTAKLVGYEDAKAFSRAFKKNRGVSPSTFKNIKTIQP